ncbi:MAG: relaxase/mobilization nuclease domain-containing protein, partial [Clostridia bacterium]|nr:relaxase/mobilization nuclease domain-containing protein [Clostridia bacterium]
MAEFKGKGIVSSVREELRYVLSDKKAYVVMTQNVVEDEDFARQFSEVAKLYGKVPKEGEITCHAFVLSPAPEDGATVERLEAYTKDVMELLFSEYQVVAAVHGDSGILHSHIVVNAVNFVTGDKLNVSMSSIRKMRDAVDAVGEFYGFSPHDPARRAMFKYQVSELREMQAGRHDWRWDVRELVQELCFLEYTEEGFRESVRRSGADVTDSKDGTDFVFHTVNSKGEPRRILGSSLGAYFSKAYILSKLRKNRSAMFPYGLPDGTGTSIAAKDALSAQGFSGKLEGPWPEAPEILSSHLIIIPSLTRRRVDLSGLSSTYDLDTDTVTDLWYNRMLDDIEKMSKYGSA